jgi:hypothetical protein
VISGIGPSVEIAIDQAWVVVIHVTAATADTRMETGITMIERRTGNAPGTIIIETIATADMAIVHTARSAS